MCIAFSPTVCVRVWLHCSEFRSHYTCSLLSRARLYVCADTHLHTAKRASSSFMLVSADSSPSLPPPRFLFQHLPSSP